jgi:hypothetical protein
MLMTPFPLFIPGYAQNMQAALQILVVSIWSTRGAWLVFSRNRSSCPFLNREKSLRQILAVVEPGERKSSESVILIFCTRGGKEGSFRIGKRNQKKAVAPRLSESFYIKRSRFRVDTVTKSLDK